MSLSDRAAAVEMGQALIDKHFGHNVVPDEIFQDAADKYYRLLDDDESNALNAGEMSECEPRLGKIIMSFNFCGQIWEL